MTQIANNIGAAAKNLGKKKISGAGGCVANDKDMGGKVVGGGAILPPSSTGPNVIGSGVPKAAKPIDSASVSKEARGSGSGDLESIKGLLAGLCG